MIHRARHLTERRLFDCYLTERDGDRMDPRAADHLSDCRSCSARYADLTRFMDGLADAADADSDAAFTSERLRAQRQQILTRIQQVGRAPRVIEFPVRSMRQLRPSAAQGLTRWVYAAAAAGLVVGVGLGAVYESDWRAIRSNGRPTVHQLAMRPRGTSIGAVRMQPVADTADDAFLSDLEVALERPHTRSLQAMDALTPHVRDLTDRVR